MKTTIILLLISCSTFGQNTKDEYWNLNKRDSISIKNIQNILPYNGEVKRTLNDIVVLLYKKYKLEYDDESDIINHTLEHIEKILSKCLKPKNKKK